MNDFNTPAEFLAALRTATIEGKRASPFVHFHSTVGEDKKDFLIILSTNTTIAL